MFQNSNKPTVKQINQIKKLLIQLGHDKYNVQGIIMRNISNDIWTKDNINKVIEKLEKLVKTEAIIQSKSTRKKLFEITLDSIKQLNKKVKKRTLDTIINSE